MNRSKKVQSRVYFSGLLVSFKITETSPTYFCFQGTWASLTSYYTICFYYDLAHSETRSSHGESMHYVVVKLYDMYYNLRVRAKTQGLLFYAPSTTLY